MAEGMKRRAVLTGLGAAAFGVPAAGLAQGGDTPRRGGTLTIGFLDNTRTLDPTFSIQLSERQSLYLIYDTLVAMDADFSLKPELAKSWRIENDGHRYVLELQEGVKFHDGTDFNAEAAKWNIDRRLDEEVASPQRAQLRPAIDNVEVVSAHVVAVNLRNPHPGLLADLADRAGCMISPTAAHRLGRDFARNPVGTGAFVFKEWVQNTAITVERNPNYWQRGLPYLDRVVFRTVPNRVIGIQRLLVGEIDFVDGLEPDLLRQLERGRDSVVSRRNPSGRWWALQYQVDKPPFDNPRLRQAIAYALDRDRLVQLTMDGQAALANGPTPEGVWWSSPDTVIYNHDPARARVLLREAGIAPSTTLTLSTPSDPLSRKVNQLVAEQLGAVGLQVTLAPVAASESYARVVQRAINFTPISWTQRADPDGLFYILFHSRGFANTTGYSNPEVDRLLDEARRIQDRPARAHLYAAAKEQIQRDLPYIFLYFSAEFSAASRRINGVVTMPDQVPRFRAAWKAA